MATQAVDAAMAAGATYADARIMVRGERVIAVKNEDVDDIRSSEISGLGVRSLIGSSWGFAASADLDAASDIGRQSVAIAHASAWVPGAPLDLADVPIVEANYETPHDEDPFLVSLSDQAALLVEATRIMGEADAVRIASGSPAVLEDREMVRLITRVEDPPAHRRVRRRDLCNGDRR